MRNFLFLLKMRKCEDRVILQSELLPSMIELLSTFSLTATNLGAANNRIMDFSIEWLLAFIYIEYM